MFCLKHIPPDLEERVIWGSVAGCRMAEFRCMLCRMWAYSLVIQGDAGDTYILLACKIIFCEANKRVVAQRVVEAVSSQGDFLCVCG